MSKSKNFKDKQQQAGFFKAKGDFSNAANKFKLFANNLSNCSGNNGLQSKTKQFAMGARYFHDATTHFNNHAQAVTQADQNAFTCIKAHFKTAANTFADGTKHLYLAPKDIPLLS